MVMAAPVKSSALDPIPTFLLRECIDVILPYLTAMVNTSLRCSRLPASQKMAVVTLLLKASLESHEFKNHRPVSNLSFMSKLVERVVVKQLTDYLKTNELLWLFGHTACSSPQEDHHCAVAAVIRRLPPDWKRPLGRPNHTWLRAVECVSMI